MDLQSIDQIDQAVQAAPQAFRRLDIPVDSGAIPLGRFTFPEDVTAVAAFVATERTGYIAGQAISVPGGAAHH